MLMHLDTDTVFISPHHVIRKYLRCLRGSRAIMPLLILGTCSLGVFSMVNDRKKGMFAQNALICPWLGMN